MNYLITEKQLKFLTEKATKIDEGSVTIENPKYRLTADGSGWLKDNRGLKMCVKVEAGLLGGTFAQGIKNIFRKKDGITIVPTSSKIGNLEMNNSQLVKMAETILSGKPYKFKSAGADITIGASVVPFCKKDWGIN